MLRYHSRDQNTYTTNDHFPPISRTLRYKKVTKPLLERKRRARINRCLDELKDLVGALEAGFSQCATEACTFLLSLPGLNSAVGNRLVDHLKQCISKHRLPHPVSSNDHRVKVASPEPLQVSVPNNQQRFSPPTSPFTNSLMPQNRHTSSVSRINNSGLLMTVNVDDVESPMHRETVNSMWRPW
ncbi:hypothetical protein PGB90_006674 [Kerria lacca]